MKVKNIQYDKHVAYLMNNLFFLAVLIFKGGKEHSLILTYKSIKKKKHLWFKINRFSGKKNTIIKKKYIEWMTKINNNTLNEQEI